MKLADRFFSLPRKYILLSYGVAILLVIAAISYFLRDDTNEVLIGERAKSELSSFTWHTSPHDIRLVEDPSDAFLTRRQLIRNASDSIDLCTFIWRDDETGLALMQELLAAAKRGVKVRLLGDGLFFLRNPDKVAAIAYAHKNIALRLYNPVDKQVASLDPGIIENIFFDFFDTNQRLHMKILAIDGKTALIGGRNVGDEYFGQHKEMNFIDRDLVIKGSSVEEIRRIFELFWGDSLAQPAENMTDVKMEKADISWLEKTVHISFPESVRKQPWQTVKRMSVWHDQPGLIGDKEHYVPKLLADRMVALVGTAEQSVLIETPYLILSDRTKELFRQMRQKKPEIPIRFLTNSLASTDTLEAYSAFQAQLRNMLEDFHLLLHLKKPHSLAEQGGITGTKVPLHAKTVVIDQQQSAIGSYNWDPRAGIWNAEIMVIIDDSALAETLSKHLETIRAPDASWIVAKRQHPVGLEQIDAIGSSIHATISEVIGINVWPLTNSSCFEPKGDKVVSPYHPDFYKYYEPVGSFPEVPMTDQRRILTNLLKPFSGLLSPVF